ncbi:hypothetical protein [Ruminococcus sp.]|jgi:hypothetical protein|uniref:hypothetical protein n=1 Tax=Ruminococcus sp. TaxID=41978 RepID=UPI003AAA7DCF
MSLSLTKKAILAGYAHSISLKGFETNRLFLVTAAGIISGIPVFDEKTDNLNITVAQALNSAALEAVSKADSPDEERSTGSGEFILLRDARFEATTPVVNFPILTVFYDQIIAVSLGTDPTNR